MAPIRKRLQQLAQPRSYKQKILLLYVAIVVIPVLLCGFLAQHIVLRNLRIDLGRSVNEAVDQVSNNIEFRKQIYELLLNRVSTDSELIERLSIDYADMLSQWETVRYIDRSFGNVEDYLPGILDFRIYHDNETLVEDGDLLWRPGDRMLGGGRQESEWYASMRSAAEPMRWEFVRNPADGADEMFLSRKIFHPLAVHMGVAYLRIDSKQIFGELMNDPFQGRGEFYLIDDQGHILAASRKEWQGSTLNERSLPWEDSAASPADVHARYPDRHVVVSTSLSSGWQVIGAVSVESLEEQTRRVSEWIVGITIAIVLISLFLMWAVLNRVVRRLRRLGKHFASIRQGRFQIAVARERADEVGELETQFNLMATQLNELMDEIADARLKEKDAEFRQLQAQINPHFLYNTLGIIRWRALDADDRELCDIVDLMTTFYRLSLNRGGSLARFREELDHVRAYIQIQQHRFQDRVRVVWDVDESLYELYTIKLILQPIVENCYMHGNVHKRKDGEIRLSGRRAGSEVVFTVSDNGAGMADDDVRRFARREPVGKNQGYGLRNIEERLRLYFGQSGSLRIDSVEGKGASVTVRMPVCTEPPSMRRGNDAASDDR